MKKPLTIPDEPQPRNVTTLEAAQKRARDLKAEFPMLQVKVYDAAEKKLLELSPTE